MIQVNLIPIHKIYEKNIYPLIVGRHRTWRDIH